MKFLLGFLGAILLADISVIAVTAVQAALRYKEKYVEDLPGKDDTESAQGKDDDIAYRNVYNALCGRKIEGGAAVDGEYIHNALKRQASYVNHRYDCSDFRLQLMFRIYKDGYEKLSDTDRALIKETFLNFKYFMDEPGDDSMCYWSENHQILFAVSEYLAGQEWENEVFTNSGMTGAQHKQKALERIEAWIAQRKQYGFSEYLSNVYLQEDIAPMANFIEYSLDRALADKMRSVMDLLWFDVATHCVKNRFVPASSRMYGNNKAGNYIGNSLLSSMNLLWGRDTLAGRLEESDLSAEERKLIENSASACESCMSINFIAAVEKGAYTLPPVIKKIACDSETRVIRMSAGQSPAEMKENGLVGQNVNQIMAQMGSETFTNGEVIKNTLRYFRENKMFRNKFIYYFKYLDTLLFRFIDIQQFAARHDIMTHGIAIGRGNVYAYRTADYIMMTAVKKDVDVCGAQDHVWSANIGENIALFSTHPARDDVFHSSPGYWIGNGRRPMSVQDRNVNVTVYKIPEKKRLAEMHISKITHLYFPKCFYDEVIHEKNMIFARKGKVLVSVVANGEMKFRPFDERVAACIYKDHPELQGTENYDISGEFDLVREGGKYHAYVTELSSLREESFAEFIERIKNNTVRFEGDGVCCKTGDRTIEVTYSGTFKINGEMQETEYMRYDGDYCKAPREPEGVVVSFDGESAKLF